MDDSKLKGKLEGLGSLKANLNIDSRHLLLLSILLKNTDRFSEVKGRAHHKVLWVWLPDFQGMADFVIFYWCSRVFLYAAHDMQT